MNAAYPCVDQRMPKLMKRIAVVTYDAPYCGEEAFVVAEADEIRRLGHDVFLFPVRFRRDAPLHDSAVGWVDQAHEWTGWTSLARGLLFACEHPGRSLAALGLILRLSAGRRRHLARNIVGFGRALQLAHWVRRSGVTHIHAAWASVPATTALVASLLTRVPWSFSAHRGDVAENNILAEKIRRAEVVRAISHRGAERLMHLSDARGRVEIVHVGITCRDSAGARAAEHPVLVSVGRLVPLKNHRALIDACAALRDRGLTFRCDIVGGGPLLEELQQHVIDLGLSNIVRVLGPVSNEWLREELRSGSWFAMVHPSLVEGIPVVLMEAMEAGMPVVATRVGETDELVHEGENGFLVPPGDVDALVESIAQLLGDPGLAIGLGRTGREFVRAEFDVAKSASRLVELMSAEEAFSDA